MLYKNDIALLDILATNNWKRPVYFTAGASPDVFSGFKKFLRYEGMVYRLMPYSSDGTSDFIYEKDILMDSYMNKIDLGDGSKAYYDNYCRRNFDIIKYRQMGNVLAAELIEEGKKEEALKVIKKSLRELPIEVAPEITGNIPLILLLHESGMTKESLSYYSFIFQWHLNNIMWFASQSKRDQQISAWIFEQELQKGQLIRQLLQAVNDTELINRFNSVYQQLGVNPD